MTQQSIRKYEIHKNKLKLQNWTIWFMIRVKSLKWPKSHHCQTFRRDSASFREMMCVPRDKTSDPWLSESNKEGSTTS